MLYFSIRTEILNTHTYTHNYHNTHTKSPKPKMLNGTWTKKKQERKKRKPFRVSQAAVWNEFGMCVEWNTKKNIILKSIPLCSVCCGGKDTSKKIYIAEKRRKLKIFLLKSSWKGKIKNKYTKKQNKKSEIKQWKET